MLRVEAPLSPAGLDPACWRRMQDKNIKHNGNLKLDNIIEIARVMSERSCAKSLAGTCKEILGTCVSVGCTVEGAHPMEMVAKVCLMLSSASPGAWIFAPCSLCETSGRVWTSERLWCRWLALLL
jgi:Ribosomal protein L11, RNA binding domain